VKDDLALGFGLMAADEGDKPEERPRQAQQDIPFEMICCGLGRAGGGQPHPLPPLDTGLEPSRHRGSLMTS
jgi:hypothetical protein